MDLSNTIRLTEAAIDQAMTEGQPITHETVSALQDTMLEWAQTVEQMEVQHETDQTEISRLRGVLTLPDDLSAATVRFDNVVPLVGRIGDGGAA